MNVGRRDDRMRGRGETKADFCPKGNFFLWHVSCVARGLYIAIITDKYLAHAS
jgi:hypothetical protein